MYRDTCMPWIEPTYCSKCGIETDTGDMLCDDCDCTTADDGFGDPNESHWAGEDRHYYNSER